MIETLILGTLAVAAATVIGYFYGKSKTDELFIKKYGWNIFSWQGHNIDRYFVAATNNGRKLLLAFSPDGSIDFDYDSTVKKHGE
jgi:hypothetical protein